MCLIKRAKAILFTLTFWLASVPVTEAIDITRAEVQNGVAVVQGNKATKQAAISWETGNVGWTTNGGSFGFSGLVPADCVGQLSSPWLKCLRASVRHSDALEISHLSVPSDDERRVH